MAFDLRDLERKRKELQEKVEQCEIQKKNVKNTIQKLTARYNIGEIGFDSYKEEYKRTFRDKSPEQWVNYYNIQVKSHKAQLSWYDSEIKRAKKALGKKKVEAIETEEKKRDLSDKIAKAEDYKKRVVGSVQDLIKKYNSREITYEQYQSEVKKLYGGNEPQKLVDYYDDYIKKAKSSLGTGVGEPSSRNKIARLIPFVLILGFVVYGLVGFPGLDFGFTGLSIQVVDEVHKKTFDLIFNESEIYDLDLPYSGELNWVKLSGAVRGEGSVRVYLDDILILDSENLEEDGEFSVTGGVITGFVAQEGEGGGGDSETDDGFDGEDEESAEAAEESEEEQSEEQEGAAEEEQEQAEENQEEQEEAVEEAEEEPPESETNETEQEEPPESETNETEQEEPPESETNETEQEEPPESETNETVKDEGPEDEPVEEPVEEIVLEDYCKESCDLSEYGLNKTSYTLKVQIENAEFELKEVEYEISIEREISEENVTIAMPPNLTKRIPDIMIEKNWYYDLDVGEYFVGAEEYYLKQTSNITTTVFEDTIRIEPADNFTGVRSTRIVVVNNFGSVGSNLFNVSVLDPGNLSEFEAQLNVTKNKTLNTTTKQYKAIINRPVKWLKKLELENVTDLDNVTVELPKESKNISIKSGREVDEALRDAEEYERTVNESDRKEIVGSGITGNVVSDLNRGKGLLTRLGEWVRGFTITGRVISEEELEDEILEDEDKKVVDVRKVVERTKERDVAVEYYTDPPVAYEQNLSNGKRVIVSGPENLNYTDILAYTMLDNSVPNYSIEDLQVYWHASYEDAVRYGYINASNVSEELMVVGRIVEEGPGEESAKDSNVSLGNQTNITEFSKGLGDEALGNDTLVNQTADAVEDDVIANGSSFLTGFAVSEFSEAELNETNPAEGNLSVSNSTEVVKKYYKVPFDFEAYDLDEDGYIDYVEWIVPHLSNQTFDIVVNSSDSSYDDNVAFDNGYAHLIPVVSSPYDSLEVYYSFDADNENDDATTHYDFSRLELDASGSGGLVANTTNCLYHQCGHFDGYQDYMSLSGHTFDSSSMTFTAWLYTDADNPGSGNNQYIARFGNRFILVKNPSTNSFLFRFWNSTGDISALNYAGTCAKGKWCHYAVSYNGEDGNVTVYIDGDSAESWIEDVGGGMASANSNLNIGRTHSSSTTYFWNGSMDEIMIFNKSLTGAQIGQIYGNNSIRFGAGNVDIKQFNVTQGQNTVNITFSKYVDGIVSSSVRARVGYWNLSRGFNNTDLDGSGNDYLVSYYHLDDTDWSPLGEMIDDDGLEGNNLRTYGNAFNRLENYPFGRVGVFDGNGDYLGDGNTDSLHGEDTVTFAAWVRREGDGAAYETIVTQGVVSNGYGLMSDCNDGKLQFLVIPDKGGVNVVEYPQSVITDGNWHHVVGTYETGNEIVLYVDGIEVNSTSVGSLNVADGYSEGVRIGGSTTDNLCTTASQAAFNGSIDEVIILNRSLDADEVRELYVKGKALWDYTSYEGLEEVSGSDESLNEFSIDRGATNVHASVQLSPGNQAFYSPLLYSPGSDPGTLTTFDQAPPLLEFVDPTSSQYSYVDSASVNLSVNEEFPEHYSFVEVNEDLLLWMNMDKFTGSVPEDLSGNDEYDPTGTLSQDPDGRYGSALDFENGEYLLSSKYIPLDGYDYSAAFWYKGTAQGNTFLGDIKSDDEEGWRIYSGTCGIGVYQDDIKFDAYTECGQVTECIVANTDDDNWHFIGVAVNETGLMFYHNGVAASENFGGDCGLIHSNEYFRIGANYVTGTGVVADLIGLLDEVVYFDRALTEDEFAALYNATASPLDTELELDDGDYSLVGWASDNSGNYNSTSGTRNFSVDTQPPSVVFSDATPEDGSYINETSFEVGIDVTDDSPVYSTAAYENDVVLLLGMDDLDTEVDPPDALDISPYDNDGDFGPLAESTESGYYGDGVYLPASSNGYVSVPHNDSITFIENWTVSMWFQRDLVGQTVRLASKGVYGGALGNGWYTGITTNTPYIYIMDGTNNQYKSATTTITDTDWHHIVYTFRDGDVYIYIDGQAAGPSSTSVNAPAYSSRDLGIGIYEPAPSSNPFNGTIDEFIMINRSLNADEIEALYNASNDPYEEQFTETADDSSYSFDAFVGDMAGHHNTTEGFTVYTDWGTPSVAFTDPTPDNNSLFNLGEITVNVSSSDSVSDTFSFIDFDESLILWYDMDNVNSTGDPVDASGNGYHGARVGDANQSVSGVWGESFGGDTTSNYLKGPGISDLNVSDGFTMSAWVDLDQTPSTGQTDYLVYFFYGSFDANYFRVAESGGSYALSAYGEYSNDIYSITKSGMSEEDLLEGWHHLVSSYNLTDVTFYVDGVKIGSDSTGTQFDDDVSIILINYDMYGRTDEFMVFNRSFAEEEVLALYNSTANELDVNFSDLVEGSHSFIAHTVDRGGNRDSTEKRFFDVDLTDPVVSFINPTPGNNSYVGEDSVTINVSSSDSGAGDHYTLLDFDEDVLLWMRMDDVSSVGDPLDSSGYENNGTALDGASQTGEGYWGSGFEFDGVGDYILVPESDSTTLTIEGGAGYSYSFWVKSASIEGSALLEHSCNAFGGGHAIKMNANGNVTYTECTGPSTTTSAAQFTQDTWHHFVLAINATGTDPASVTLRFYLDGSLVDEGNAFVVDGTDNNITIGAGDLGGGVIGEFFNGSMDEVLVFNRTITVGEVLALYNATAYQYNVTHSNLSEGSHSFRSYAVDRGGNRDSTEKRFFDVDLTDPVLSFANPTPGDGDLIAENSALINVSSEDYHDPYILVGFENDLLLYLRMDDTDDSGDPTDLSSYEHDGTLEGQATISRSAGYFGDGLDQDGSGDYVSIGTSSALNSVYNDLTISMWAKSDEEATEFPGLNSGLWIMRQSSTERIYGTLRDNSGTYVGVYNDIDDISAYDEVSISSSLKSWHHYVWVFNETHLTVYMNGTLVRSDTLGKNLSLLNDGYVLDIGRGYTSTSYYNWNGTIDEAIVLNRSLTEQEVKALYNASLYRYERNFTSLKRGEIYNYTTYSVDRAGNLVSEERGFETNEAPYVSFVEYGETQNPLEDGVRTIEVNFSVYDANGYDDIGAININFTRGSSVRADSLCASLGNSEYEQNYSCGIDLYYFDEPGEWNITIQIEDDAGAISFNDTESFTYTLLKAMVLSPNILDFGSAGTTVGEITGPSHKINNTGNYDAQNITIEGQNLVGQSDATELSVGNFTASIFSPIDEDPTPTCDAPSQAVRLVEGQRVNVTESSLPAGDHSIDDGNTGQEVIYYCIPEVPNLPTQVYSTGGGDNSQWIIRMALAALALGGSRRRRKRKKKLVEESELLDVLDEKLFAKYGVKLQEVLVNVKRAKVREAAKVKIPVDVFRQEIGAAESLCKYLRENKGMNYSEMARVLNRDQRTVWINYSNARKKSEGVMKVKSRMSVPASIFMNRKLSILEAVVHYMKGRGMKNSEIATLLGKDPRNIYTLYSRAVKKLMR